MKYAIEDGYSLFAEDLDHVAATLATMPELRGAHVFLTGGTGFIGIWLTECLLWASEHAGLDLRVTSLARTPDKFYAKHPYLRRHKALRLVQGDLRHFPVVDAPVTLCVHAATVVSTQPPGNWAYEHLDAAIDGTRSVLALARRDNAPALIVSSGGAYRMPVDNPTDNRHGEEVASLDEATSERVIYGLGKRVMEGLAATWSRTHGIKANAARCFAFVGPWLPLDANYAAGNFLRDALRGGPIVISGDGTPLRSYLYPTDLVVWLLTILLRGQPGIPYNVGAQRAVSITELAQLTAKAVGLPETALCIRGTPVPGAKPAAYLPDTGRAKALGLAVTTDLEEALHKTYSWYNHYCKGSTSCS